MNLYILWKFDFITVKYHNKFNILKENSERADERREDIRENIVPGLCYFSHKNFFPYIIRKNVTSVMLI